MKFWYLAVIYFLTICSGFSQEDYFQQEVNYMIDVVLNEKENELHGSIEIEYHNNSSESLDKIYMHLWPNAYASKNSAFAKQALELDNTDFHFADDQDLGSIDSLDFLVNGERVIWKLDGKDQDIGLIILNELLPAGGKILISSPFRVKIPKSFSRMGRDGNTFQITQWYPKPAVYDVQGWHPMPYLAMGEFYAEFGSYDVRIDVPADYIVAATGNLQNPEEQQWLQSIANQSAESDRSTQRKKLRYTQNNVHDFAWFANPKFKVKHKTINLDGEEKVIWVFHTEVQSDLWSEALDYATSSMQFFSEKVGTYPYDQFSIVQAPFQAGGGMEYPTITVIDQVTNAEELQHVIAHEVGHNWFQGILGFNERDYPWLDEGLTTYYDHRYINAALQTNDRFKHYLPSFLKNNVHLPLMNYAVLSQSHRRLDQAINTPTDKLSMANYVISGYMKPTLAFQYLEDYLGTDRFDEVMKAFYAQWKFKHPQPQDLESHFRDNVDKDLSWFFDGLVNSNGTVDYKIASKKSDDNNIKVVVENKGDINIPYHISAIKGEEVNVSIWQDGHEGIQTIDIPEGDYDMIYLDAEGRSLDINRYNNQKVSAFKKLNYKLGVGLDDDKKRRRYIMPSLGYNAYDGLMIGLSDFSAMLPNFKFQDNFSVFYGLGSGQFVGQTNNRLNYYWDETKPKQLTVALNGKSFHYNNNEEFDYELRYWRLSPSIKYSYKPSFKSKTTHSYSYALHFYRLENPNFQEGEFIDKFYTPLSMNHQLQYTLHRGDALFPFTFNGMLEYESYENIVEEKHNYLNLSLEWDGSFMYANQKKIGLRIYYTKFLSNSQRDIGSVNNALVRGTRSLAYQGFTDNYEELFIGRSDQSGIWAQQVLMREGGFKYNIGSSFPALGQSNDYLASLNLTMDLPIKLPKFLPLRLYFDAGFYNSKGTSNNDFELKSIHSGGIELNIIPDVLAIYIPVINSKRISDAYNTINASTLRKVSFQLNLRKLSPWEIIDKVGW